MAQLEHLFLEGFVEDRPFKSNLSVRGTESPQRDRGDHGNKLLNQLQALQLNLEDLAGERAARGLDTAAGLTIAIQFSPDADYDFKKLEWSREGIEVLSVVDGGNGPVVALYVPDGRLGALERRVHEYLNEDTRHGKPKNAALINAIDAIRQAAFEELWTEEEPAPANLDVPQWFQLWLRVGDQAPRDAVQAFVDVAQQLEIEVEAGFLTFPGRVVLAAMSTRRALEQALSLLDAIAEIRSVQPNAAFFMSDLTPREQAHWIQELRGRCIFAEPNFAPYVTLLDTGVNRAHLLLQDAIEEEDVQAVLDEWGGTDQNGHGTEMAGIACYGNLVHALGSDQDIEIPHRLESVKIFPPVGANPPHLYGWIYAQAVSKVEANNPDRQRIFATMTTAIGPSAGKPTEWSAAVDQLAFGLDGLQPYSSGVDWATDLRLR